MIESRANVDLFELRRELDTIQLDERKPPVARHVEMLRSVLGMEMAGSFTFDTTGTLDAFAFLGLSATATEEYRRGVVCIDRTWGMFEPWAIPACQQNRVVVCQTQRFLEGSPRMLRTLGLSSLRHRELRRSFIEQSYSFHERHRFQALWQVRCVLSEGGRLTGWVGGLSEGRPTKKQRLRLEFLLPSILRRAALLRRAGAQTQGLIEALLAQFGRAAYLVAASGRVLHANRPGIDTLESAGAAERVRAALLGGEASGFDVTELSGRGVPAMALVIERANDRAMPDLTRFGFTPRQAIVAARLCSGLNNQEIAADLGISERTVEFHLTAIYDRLGVEQRAAAIARLLG